MKKNEQVVLHYKQAPVSRKQVSLSSIMLLIRPIRIDYLNLRKCLWNRRLLFFAQTNYSQGWYRASWWRCWQGHLRQFWVPLGFQSGIKFLSGRCICEVPDCPPLCLSLSLPLCLSIISREGRGRFDALVNSYHIQLIELHV